MEYIPETIGHGLLSCRWKEAFLNCVKDRYSFTEKIHWKHQHLLSCPYIPTTIVHAAASKNRQSLSLNNLKSGLKTLSDTSILIAWSDMLATSGKLSNRPSPHYCTSTILPPSVPSSVDSLSSQFPSAFRVSSPLRYTGLNSSEDVFSWGTCIAAEFHVLPAVLPAKPGFGFRTHLSLPIKVGD